MEDTIQELLSKDEIILALIIPVISILLGTNENVLMKSYQKKYILINYSLILLNYIFLRQYKSLIYIGFFITISLGSINLSYQTTSLEKKLSKKRLFIYKWAEWFFITKSYVFILCTLFLTIIDLLEINNKADDFISYIIIAAFTFYHLFSNIVDEFGLHSFEHIKDKLENNIKCFDEKYNHKITEHDFILDGLGFIVYMEDKDYFKRKSPLYCIKYSFKRKKIGNKRYHPKKLKTLIRGYSTIQQQLIRTFSLKEDSYKYRIRRKLLCEYIYNSMFFIALTTQKTKYHGNYDLEEMKVNLLKVYYINILKNPKEVKELVNRMQGKRLNSRDYEHYFWEFKYSKEYEEIKTIFRRVIMVSKIKYNRENEKLFLISNNNQEIYLEQELPSVPEVSPNKEKAVFISPYEWECQGDIYLVNLVNNEVEKIHYWEVKKQPKCVRWESNESLLVILGETYGTVSTGGNLYRLKLNNDVDKLKLIKEFPPEIQIEKIEIKFNEIHLLGVKYVDDNYNEKVDYIETLKI